jgi:hypothetical protein
LCRWLRVPPLHTAGDSSASPACTRPPPPPLRRYGISGLIIDPYNELDPSRPYNVKEHEAVNALMAHLRKFARDNQVGRPGVRP